MFEPLHHFTPPLAEQPMTLHQQIWTPWPIRLALLGWGAAPTWVGRKFRQATRIHPKLRQLGRR